jgi:hypothetical protein
MTPLQNIWVLLCTVGPAIYVGLAVNWWSGIIAYFLATLLGSLLGWSLVSVVPVQFLAACGVTIQLKKPVKVLDRVFA